MDARDLRVGVLGAGLIGGYVGGRLAASGVDVMLVGRESFRREIAEHGLRLTDHAGANLRAAPERLTVVTDPAPLSGCDVVLVTVKSLQTADAGRELKPVLRADTVVVSLQNGVRNAQVLSEAIGGRALAGMVPFNVVRSGPGHLHQASSGTLAFEKTGAEALLVAALNRAGLPARSEPDMRTVQWGKLLFNLNNAVNALAGIPLKAELQQRGYRKVLARCMTEALDVLRRAGIHPRSEAPLPAAWIPWVLRLPDPLFRLVAASMLRVDANARSSMQEDLDQGRKTEIDSLNGEIVTLARQHGSWAPWNEAITVLVHAAEGKGSPKLDPEALQDGLAVATTTDP